MPRRNPSHQRILAVGLVAAVGAAHAATATTTAAATATTAATATAAFASPSPWCTDPSHPAEVGMYGNLGFVDLVDNRDLPADSPTAAGLFRQGLAQLYGFNLVEALRNFRSATALSPDCALCHWGVAMSFAPNINYAVENQTSLNNAAAAASRLAQAQPTLSAKTRALINATAQLTAPPDHVDSPTSAYRVAFADALCSSNVTSANPAGEPGLGDPDLDTFCAGALMALSPWDYYQGEAAAGSFPLREFLSPAKAKLLGAVNRGAGPGPGADGNGGVASGGSAGSLHVLASHLLIHLLEPSNAPATFRWEALAPTLALYNGSTAPGAEAVPSQGHLTHMPAHLFIRTGLYNEAVETSGVSTSDNARYNASCLTPYGLGHNLKMGVANARLAGRQADALRFASAMLLPDAGSEVTPNGGHNCVDCGGPGSPELVLTLARFGQWAEVLAKPLPPPGPAQWGVPVFAAYNEAAWRYARAAAYWALAAGPGRVASTPTSPSAPAAAAAASDPRAAPNATLMALGDKEAALSRSAAARAFTPNNLVNYTVTIPEQLSGARAWRVDRDWAQATSHYANAVAADDAGRYMEPPRLWTPPRHCLGALLLATPSPNRTAARLPLPLGARNGSAAAQALAVFERDLYFFVENGWALHGAAAAAAAAGQPALAANYSARATRAWARADAPFVSPCPELFV